MGYGARGLLGASQFYGPWGSRHFLRKWPSQRICNTLVWRKCSFWSTSRSLCFYHDVQIWCLLSTIVPINEESNLHHIHHDRKFNTQWWCLLSISLVRFCEEYWWSRQCFSKEKTRWCGPMLLTKRRMTMALDWWWLVLWGAGTMHFVWLKAGLDPHLNPGDPLHSELFPRISITTEVQV